MQNRVYKFLINWYQSSDKPLPAWLERACANNPELAQERELGESLTAELRRRPNDVPLSTEDSMAARVLRQITEEDYLAEQEQRRSPAAFGSWVRGLGIAAAIAMVGVVALQTFDSEKDPVGEGQGTSLAAKEVNDAELPEAFVKTAEDWKNPLDQEIEYIVSDAKGAIGFLASSFVPSSYMKKLEGDLRS